MTKVNMFVSKILSHNVLFMLHMTKIYKNVFALSLSHSMMEVNVSNAQNLDSGTILLFTASPAKIS